jgi:type VI secretion system protein ImpH
MATEDRMSTVGLDWLARLYGDARSFDLHVALRRFEASFPQAPRLGEAVRPADEPLRLGQTPSAAFEPTAITGFTPAGPEDRAKLLVTVLGLWGPQGPLPAHLTEYVRERVRNAGDRTLASLVDIFHHRMLLLLHRAWAKAQPTASMDRPEADTFGTYVACFLGLGLDSTRGRDSWSDRAKLFYAGRLRASPRNAEGLREMVADHLGLPTAIEEFVGEWVTLPPEARCRLGPGREASALSRAAVLGCRVWTRGHRLRIVLGPLSRDEFERMLPTSETIATLTALVRSYTNDEWAWDAVLQLRADAVDPVRLGGQARLGWTTRIGTPTANRTALVVEPMSGGLRRVRVSRPGDDGDLFAKRRSAPHARILDS